jgi:Helix-turn-helix domain
VSTHVSFGQPTQPRIREPYVKADAAAEFLNLSPKHVLRLARENVLPSHNVSRENGKRQHKRFLISELDVWMRSQLNSGCHPSRR